MSTRLRLGFIALNDAASVIVAEAKGFFEAEGLDVELSREVSWATMRDKMAVGALQGTHMLSPTALAISLGAAGTDATPLVAPFALNLNGPAVTLSSRLAGSVGSDGRTNNLARLVARRREEGATPITLAVVFPFSTHNYLLRDWLAAAGIDPDHDVRLVVAPPSRMTGLLADGVVEGFCVTEPWGTAAVAAGAGMIAVRGAQLWPRTPDKVLAVTEAWAEQNPEVLQAMLRALYRAAAWVDAPENRPELAVILAQPEYVAADPAVIERSLAQMVFHCGNATTPAPVHGGWLMAQMMRWGHLPATLDIPATAGRIYRPDLHAAALASLGEAPEPPVESLSGYRLGQDFRLEDAASTAAEAPLSRLPRA